MPLKFLTHRYAIDHVTMIDAPGYPLSFSSGTYSGGSSSALFAVRHIVSFETGMDKKPQIPVEYPVTINVRLPKRYETERVTFEFESLDLPPLQ